jgi:hypothetical protein
MSSCRCEYFQRAQFVARISLRSIRPAALELGQCLGHVAAPLFLIGTDAKSQGSNKVSDKMRRIFTFRTTLLGLASWLIPFAASFLFFDGTGQLLISQPLFKSIMVLVGGVSGAALLVAAFRRIEVSPASAFALGCYWLAINLVFDVVALVALMRMPLALYLYDIGLRYLLIPVISTSMGIVAVRAAAGAKDRLQVRSPIKSAT